MSKDRVAAIAEAQRNGVDLTADMSESDWVEYRAQCSTWLETDMGQAHKKRALERIAAKQALINEAS